MVFKNVTNVIFTNMCNPNLNPSELSNEASLFCYILFDQHMFIMFLNIRQLHCIIFGKSKSALKKIVICLCDIFTNTM